MGLNNYTVTEEQALFHLSEKSCIPRLHCMMCLYVLCVLCVRMCVCVLQAAGSMPSMALWCCFFFLGQETLLTLL